MPHWLGWLAVPLLSIYLAVYPAVGALAGWWIGKKAAHGDVRLFATILAGDVGAQRISARDSVHRLCLESAGRDLARHGRRPAGDGHRHLWAGAGRDAGGGCALVGVASGMAAGGA